MAVKVAVSPGQIGFLLTTSVPAGNGVTVITTGPKVAPQLKLFATSTVTDAPFVNADELKIFELPDCLEVPFTLKM